MYTYYAKLGILKTEWTEGYLNEDNSIKDIKKTSIELLNINQRINSMFFRTYIAERKKGKF